MVHIMNKIIDIHNHSLSNVDDGAKDLQESINNIKYLKNLGITDIILTSHYNPNLNYIVSVLDRKKLLKTLKDACQELNVNLYLGNEVYIHEANTIIDLLNENKITTLNNSKYLLLEFPFSHKINHLDVIICELNELGIKPIIAHPERYSYLTIADLKKLLEYDCLLQCNISSIIGHYGKSAKKRIKELLKQNMVSFLATDFHHHKDKDLEKSLKKLKKYLSVEEMQKLLYDNPLKVIANSKL